MDRGLQCQLSTYADSNDERNTANLNKKELERLWRKAEEARAEFLSLGEGQPNA